jgi:hypothetical protein
MNGLFWTVLNATLCWYLKRKVPDSDATRTTFPFRLSTLTDLTSRHSPPGPSESGAQWHPTQTQQLKPQSCTGAPRTRSQTADVANRAGQRSTRVRSWHGVCDPAKQRLASFDSTPVDTCRAIVTRLTLGSSSSRPLGEGRVCALHESERISWGVAMIRRRDYTVL